MINRYRFQSIILTIVICGIVLSILVGLKDQAQIVDILSPLAMDEHTVSDTPRDVIQTTVSDASPEIPVPIIHTVTFVDSPIVLSEGEIATFTWNVDGDTSVATKSGVYIGTTSVPGVLPDTLSPMETAYMQVVKDFINGSYIVPLRFVAGMTMPQPGTYFGRAYVFIDGKHYWSDERSFIVKPKPKHEIRIVNLQKTAIKGENIPFTWEVLGPKTTMPFTTIVYSKLSKPGAFDTTITIPQTPYTVLVKDFTNGTYEVPLRFIGNAAIPEPGEYYLRAIAFVNDKNIWSEEYQMTIK